MKWLVAALASTVFFSILNVATKKLTKDTSGLAYTTAFTISATVLYTPLFIYYCLQTGVNAGLLPWIAVIGSGLANTLGIIAYNDSIKYGEVSEVIPLTKVTPVFTAILGYSILGEQMDMLTVTGILAVTVGSYVVLLKKHETVLQPFRRVLGEKAPLLAFSTSIIYAFASIADRFGAQAIPPQIYGYIIFATMTTTLLTYLGIKDREKLLEAKNITVENPFKYTGVGVLGTSAFLSIFIAYSMAPASKVVPVLQLQVLASVAAGGYLFREEDILRKTVGSTALITGVILLAI